MTDERSKAFRSWAKLLNPEELRANLIRASIFLTAYELMSQALIEHLLLQVADGNDETLRRLYEQFKKQGLVH